MSRRAARTLFGARSVPGEGRSAGGAASGDCVAVVRQRELAFSPRFDLRLGVVVDQRPRTFRYRAPQDAVILSFGYFLGAMVLGK